ncbi:MAG: hypothetical protein KC983_02760 [Phycisphaerales bacterium]|nr:hypothetical protein [Phycisphaerales bacterium]
MSNHEHEQPDRSSHDDVLEVDILIGRLVDDEASDADRARFERLAELEPAVWRRYALRLADHAHLTAAFERSAATAFDVDLPGGNATSSTSSSPARFERRGQDGSFFSWRAVSGWAAVVVLGATWFIMSQREAVPERLHSLTPAEYLDGYRHAPFIENEYSPLLLETEEMIDGKIGIRFMRRFEESIVLDRATFEAIYNPKDGAFREDPAEYRGG